jgi:hypothetical protein
VGGGLGSAGPTAYVSAGSPACTQAAKQTGLPAVAAAGTWALKWQLATELHPSLSLTSALLLTPTFPPPALGADTVFGALPPPTGELIL